VLLAVALLVAVLWLPNAVGWTLVGLAFLFEIGEIAFWVRWNKRREIAHTGGEALPGRTAIVVLACRPDGQVSSTGSSGRRPARGRRSGPEGGRRVRQRAHPGHPAGSGTEG
jgi:membrane protein implicated in regulation of membrane protease activity